MRLDISLEVDLDQVPIFRRRHYALLVVVNRDDQWTQRFERHAPRDVYNLRWLVQELIPEVDLTGRGSESHTLEAFVHCCDRGFEVVQQYDELLKAPNADFAIFVPCENQVLQGVVIIEHFYILRIYFFTWLRPELVVAISVVGQNGHRRQRCSSAFSGSLGEWNVGHTIFYHLFRKLEHDERGGGEDNVSLHRLRLLHRECWIFLLLICSSRVALRSEDEQVNAGRADACAYDD